MLSSHPKLRNPLYGARRAGLTPVSVQREREREAAGGEERALSRTDDGRPSSIQPGAAPKATAALSCLWVQRTGLSLPISLFLQRGRRRRRRRRSSPVASCLLFFQPLHHNDTLSTRAAAAAAIISTATPSQRESLLGDALRWHASGRLPVPSCRQVHPVRRGRQKSFVLLFVVTLSVFSLDFIGISVKAWSRRWSSDKKVQYKRWREFLILNFLVTPAKKWQL